MTGPTSTPDHGESGVVWVPPGAGRQVRRINGEDTVVLADGSQTTDAYAVRLNTTPPEFQSVPLHRHREAEEAFYVSPGHQSAWIDAEAAL